MTKSAFEPQELQKRVGMLVEAQSFDEADALIETNAIQLPEELQMQPFDAAVAYRGFDQETASMHEGQTAVDFLTGLSRKARNARAGAMMKADPDGLRILEEGDSWHQYPAFLQDLVDQIRFRHATWSLSAPSDTLEEMVLQDEFVNAIHRHDPDVFLIGGGGNDILGQGRFITLLQPHFEGASVADVLNMPVLEVVLSRLRSHYVAIIAKALAAKPNLQIVLHGYDEAIPRPGGRWLGRPLRDRGIPLELGTRVVRVIIGRFDRELAAIARSHAGSVHHVDMRGRVGDLSDDWSDEIHPKGAGFERCAAPLLDLLNTLDQRRDALRANGVAPVSEGLGALPGASRSDLAAKSAYLNMSEPIADSHAAADPRAPKPFSVEQVAAARQELDSILSAPATEDPARVATRIAYSTRTDARNYEAIINENDLDEFHFLERGHMVGRAVARVYTRGPGGGYGTGFLVAPGLLLTNNHVIPTREAARASLATFDHALQHDNTPLQAQHFQLGDALFLTSVELDYTLLSVAQSSTTGMGLAEYGTIGLLPRSGKALLREHVCIVQHPGGDYKKVVVRSNTVVGRGRNHLYYLSDTMPGSSGSPVFNTEWQVAALHHMAIPGKGAGAGFVANRGVRISSILKDISDLRGDTASDAAAIDALLRPDAPDDTAPPAPPSPRAASAGPPPDGSITSQPEDWAEALDAAQDTARPAQPESTPPRLPATAASWPANHRNAPDTWHLPAAFADASFELTPDLLRRITETSRFEPISGPEGNIIFALRGCRLADGTEMAEDRSGVALTTATVDHETPRCVVGVWHGASGRVSVFAGSTVPRRTEMKRYYDNVNFDIGGTMCNMLPAGCYTYCVGTHYSRRNGAITYVLRQGHGPDPQDRSTVTTLRTANDLTYGTRDIWDKSRPADNIHPAFIPGSFSSQGCLTVPGHQAGHGASHHSAAGAWEHFRRRAGFEGRNMRELYSLVLITGHEAAALHHAASDTDRDALVCLRHGSRGADVAALQRHLGEVDDGIFGPQTKLSLCRRQFSELGYATGTWGPEMSELMKADRRPVPTKRAASS